MENEEQNIGTTGRLVSQDCKSSMLRLRQDNESSRGVQGYSVTDEC